MFADLGYYIQHENYLPELRNTEKHTVHYKTYGCKRKNLIKNHVS